MVWQNAIADDNDRIAKERRNRTDLEPVEWIPEKVEYSRAFKLQALELVKTGQKSISEIERDLGITPGVLHKWKAQMKTDGASLSGKGHQNEELTHSLLSDRLANDL